MRQNRQTTDKIGFSNTITKTKTEIKIKLKRNIKKSKSKKKWHTHKIHKIIKLKI